MPNMKSKILWVWGKNQEIHESLGDWTFFRSDCHNKSQQVTLEILHVMVKLLRDLLL